MTHLPFSYTFEIATTKHIFKKLTRHILTKFLHIYNTRYSEALVMMLIYQSIVQEIYCRNIYKVLVLSNFSAK